MFKDIQCRVDKWTTTHPRKKKKGRSCETAKWATPTYPPNHLERAATVNSTLSIVHAVIRVLNNYA